LWDPPGAFPAGPGGVVAPRRRVTRVFLGGVPAGARGGFRVSFPLRTNYMFARARGTVRRALRALSACLWLRPGGAPAIGTPFSYAAPGQPNELVLLAWGGRPMELLVDDQ
ncbi:NPTX2 protein, partial [Cepphus grylle]|nr:NPTX2 protein [Cepphus grylle]